MAERKRRTTRRQFETFRRECLRWQKKLGLSNWRLYIVHEDCRDGPAHAELEPNLSGAVATVRFQRTCGPVAWDDLNPRRSAKHEMLHLLTARLYLNGAARCVSGAELSESWESLVRRLEKVL